MADPLWVNPNDEDAILAQARQRRARFQAMQGQVTEVDARRAAELTTRFPNASPGLIQAGVQEQMDDPTFAEVAKYDGGGEGESSGFVGSIADFVTDGVSAVYEQGIKPLIRGVFTVADTIAQEVVQRPLTAASAAAYGDAESFGEAYEEYGDSPGLNILQGDLAQTTDRGQPVEGGSLGTGFFPGGQAAAQSQQERDLTINGREATLGRATPWARQVGNLYGYDSTAYNTVAGISQFAADVALDPLALTLGGSPTLARGAVRAGMVSKGSTGEALIKSGASGVRKRARMFDPSDATRILDEFDVADDVAPRAVPDRTVDAGELQPRESVRSFAARPSEFTDTMFREVDVGTARAYVPGGDAVMVSNDDIFMASSRNMARGQGRNTGVTLEFDTDAIDAQARVNTSKPAWEASWDAGEAEFRVLTSPEKLRGAVRSITVKSDAAAAKGENISLQRTLDELAEEGWQRVEVDEGVKYVRPLAPEPDAAQQFMEEAGAVSARGRNTVLIEKTQDLLGRRDVLGNLAEADAYTIFQSFKRSAANQLDTKMVRALGNAKTEEDVSRVLLDAVQRGKVTEKGFYSGLSGFRKRAADSKLAGTSARGKVTVDDLDDATVKLDSFMRQANVGRDERAGIFQRLIDLDDVDEVEKTDAFFDVVTDAMEEVTRSLDGDVEAVVAATRGMRDQISDLREFGIDVAGDPIATPMFPAKIDPGTGTKVVTPGPQLTSELAKEGFTLPDVTTIRRAAKRATNMQKLYNSAGWKVGSDAARFATRDLFKPAAILRPAYILRIGLEEQLRLAAAGYDSLFNHPMRFIQANVLARTEAGATGRTARALQRAPGGGGVDKIEMNRTLGGDNFEEIAETLNVINRRAHNVMADPIQGRTRQFTQMTKPASGAGDSKYLGAWRHELAQLSAAREARWLARNGGDVDGFVDWARHSEEGRQTIERLARTSDDGAVLRSSDDVVRELGMSIKQRLAAKAGGEVDEDGVVLAMGDGDILDAIADGRMANIRLSDTSQNASANLNRLLRSKWELGPHRLKVEIDDPVQAVKQKNQARKAVDYLFENITGKPTSYLARYPAFRQSYVKRAGEMMGALTDDATRVAYSRQIDEALTLTRAEKETLAGAVARNAGKKGFYDDLTELDEVVKFKSASEVKDLLFDVTNRSNIQDTYEVALPFFDAWLEVTETWAKLLKDNPGFFIKASQGYQSLRDSGVVYANDFGEEVFAYPGGGMLSKFFGNEDASLRLEGRVQGANLVAQGFGPGFGPLVQWGVGGLMPTTREWEEVREWMAPFGTGGVERAGDLADPAALLQSFIPAWAEKATNAITSGKIDEVQWNSTVGDVMKVLAESGRYNPADPDSQQQLIEDSKRGGRFVLWLRALTQSTAITGASATWEVNAEVEENAVPQDWDPETDPDGQWHSIGTLASELHRLAEFYGYDWQMATAKFTEMYGIEPHYITQSKSQSLTESPVTTEGDYWMAEHEDFAERHKAVAGYFVPPEEDPELDYSVYRRQFESGDRQSLTVEQQYALANKTKARSIYYNIKDQLDARPNVSASAKRAALSQVRAQLEGQFPGWQDNVPGVGESLTNEQKIERLAVAARDPGVADSPVTEPLLTYLDARERLLGVAEQRGYGSLNNQASADLRGALDDVAQVLVTKHPAFRGVWSSVLSREIEG